MSMIALTSIGMADASIYLNQETIYIGSDVPNIIDNPSDYMLTFSDIMVEVINNEVRNSNRLCKPYVENGVIKGVHISNPNYCSNSKEVYQIIDINGVNSFPVDAMIMTLHPSNRDGDYNAMMQNLKDRYSIKSNYKASFENLPQLGDRSFFMPTTVSPDGEHRYLNMLVVQSGNIIIRIGSITFEEDKNSKDLLIDFARKYLTKISQVRNNQPNLIIQANADKTSLEVGDTLNIEFKSTTKALITVKNDNVIIDSFILDHIERKNYIVNKANGLEIIEISGITPKGKTDFTQISITSKNKTLPTSIVIQPSNKESPGFVVVLSVFLILIVSLIFKSYRK